MTQTAITTSNLGMPTIMNDPVFNEILDLVDHNDQVIGSEKRGIIHQKGLMHRAVHILVFNLSGKIFIQKRAKNKDENPGLWDSSAAGHVNSGENYFDCANRELNEELGISDYESLELLCHLTPTALSGMEHCEVYVCRYDGPIKLQAEEIDEGKWLSTAEMNARVNSNKPGLTDIIRLIWQRYEKSTQADH